MFRTSVVSIAILAVTSGSAVAGQGSRQLPPQPPASVTPAPDAPRLTAGEVQRLFDAYALEQAQEALQLTEEQYGRFVTRLKALHETRRRHLQARNLILADLRRLTDPKAPRADDNAIRDRVRALRDEEDRGQVDLRKAYEAVDEVLDARQQARFRLFEEQMERRKLEILMRARQNARAARRGGGR